MIESFIKITFIQGLGEIVSAEIANHPKISIDHIGDYFAYLNKESDIPDLLQIKSITNAYLVKRDPKIHPSYISNHKSILMEMVEQVLTLNNNKITSFKISCAGDDSAEVASIKRHIIEQYKIVEDPEDADLKIHMGKDGDVWEIDVEMTPRPLSQRDYKVAHIKGGIHPTIAYAINSLCNLPNATSYLNPCSGSATLLIEAAHINPNLTLVGFDNNRDHISLSIQNLREAKLLKSIQIKFLDLFDQPDLGIFDVITSDLPFGMHIGKGEDLEKLYQAFLSFCEKSLNSGGVLAVYTTETEIFESLMETAAFAVARTIDLKIVTNVNSYIYPKIYICKFTK